MLSALVRLLGVGLGGECQLGVKNSAIQCTFLCRRG